MKKLLISKDLQSKIPVQLIKQIYIVLSSLPVSQTKHLLRLHPTISGLHIHHSIPLTDFNCTIELNNRYNIDNTLEIVAFDKGDRIMMAFSSEIK